MSVKRTWNSSDLKLTIIGDEDTVAGFLLAGIGYKDPKGNVNFLSVTSKTPTSKIEDAFADFASRSDVGVVLINQSVAERIRPLLDTYKRTIPTILEIPSKDAPYDASKDSVMQRVKVFFGGAIPGVQD